MATVRVDDEIRHTDGEVRPGVIRFRTRRAPTNRASPASVVRSTPSWSATVAVVARVNVGVAEPKALVGTKEFSKGKSKLGLGLATVLKAAILI